MVEEIVGPGVVSKMYPRNLFVYSAYWGTWSRVLQFMQSNNAGQVEVNLTAVNIQSPLDWPRVAAINIRRHTTSRSSNDKYVKELPASALWHMQQWLEPATIERLLHEDLLPQIDWDLHRQHTNGGCPLDLCQKQ